MLLAGRLLWFCADTEDSGAKGSPDISLTLKWEPLTRFVLTSKVPPWEVNNNGSSTAFVLSLKNRLAIHVKKFILEKHFHEKVILFICAAVPSFLCVLYISNARERHSLKKISKLARTWHASDNNWVKNQIFIFLYIPIIVRLLHYYLRKKLILAE